MFKTQKGEILHLIPFADDETEEKKEGGEGVIYRFDEAYHGKKKRLKVAKIFKDKILSAQKELEEKREKLFYMSQHPIDVNRFGKNIIWVDELIYNENQFVGFTMPLVKGAMSLESLININITDSNNKWTLFDYKQKNGVLNRIKVCIKICEVLAEIHYSGKYVLVDMKPSNIMVKPDGEVYFIDMDSIQINEDQLFNAKVATAEYTPPEQKRDGISWGKQIVNLSWDLFSLGVIIYKVIFCIYPFMGTLDENSSANELYLKDNGLFTKGKNGHKFRVIPTPNNNLDNFPDLNHMFIRCFDEGYVNPKKRPTALEWYKALNQELVVGKVNNVDFTGNLPKKYKKQPIHTNSNNKKHQSFPLATHSIPLIIQFYTNSSIVQYGQPITLHWNISGGNIYQVNIFQSKINGKPCNILINSISSLNGRIIVYPKINTTYTIKCISNGQLVSKHLDIQVSIPQANVKFSNPTKFNKKQKFIPKKGLHETSSNFVAKSFLENQKGFFIVNEKLSESKTFFGFLSSLGFAVSMFKKASSFIHNNSFHSMISTFLAKDILLDNISLLKKSKKISNQEKAFQPLTYLEKNKKGFEANNSKFLINTQGLESQSVLHKTKKLDGNQLLLSKSKVKLLENKGSFQQPNEFDVKSKFQTKSRKVKNTL